jgi:hypothetical protein
LKGARTLDDDRARDHAVGRARHVQANGAAEIQDIAEEVPMRKAIVSEFVSLDGVMGAPDQWHFPHIDEEMGQEILAAPGQSDAMLMVRVNYEEWTNFCPRRTRRVIPSQPT